MKKLELLVEDEAYDNYLILKKYILLDTHIEDFETAVLMAGISRVVKEVKRSKEKLVSEKNSKEIDGEREDKE